MLVCHPWTGDHAVQIREIDDPRLIKALAHPLRIQILRVLSNRVASPREISDEISARLPNVSYHVRFLERVGVIELVRTRQRRGAVEHYYRARGRLRITDRVWNQVPETIKDAVIDAALAQAISQITAAASAHGFTRKDSLASRWTMTLDDQGFREVSAIVHDALKQVREVEEKSVKRMAAKNHAVPEIRTGLVITLFEAAPIELEATIDGHQSGSRPRTRRKSSAAEKNGSPSR
jgi:DNA-binding transcriptional ArsR family regulator